MSPVAFVESPVLLLFFFFFSPERSERLRRTRKNKKHFLEQKVEGALSRVSGSFPAAEPRSGFSAVTRVGMDQAEAVLLTSPPQIVLQVLPLAAGDLSQSASCVSDSQTLLDSLFLTSLWKEAHGRSFFWGEKKKSFGR